MLPGGPTSWRSFFLCPPRNQSPSSSTYLKPSHRWVNLETMTSHKWVEQGLEIVDLGLRYYFMLAQPLVDWRVSVFIHSVALPGTLHNALAQGSFSQNPGLNGGTGTNKPQLARKALANGCPMDASMACASACPPANKCPPSDFSGYCCIQKAGSSRAACGLAESGPLPSPPWYS